MKKREQKLTTKFLEWVSVNFRHTFAFEVKQTAGNALSFSALKEHQKRALMISKHGFFRFKIPDAGWENPFDGFCLNQVPSYVVVFYGRNFYLIDIDSWCEEEKRSLKKSLTEERAKIIAIKGLSTQG